MVLFSIQLVHFIFAWLILSNYKLLCEYGDSFYSFNYFHKADHSNLERPKLFIKFFLHSSGSIAAKFQYNQVRGPPLWAWVINSRSFLHEKSIDSVLNIQLFPILGPNFFPFLWRACSVNYILFGKFRL